MTFDNQIRQIHRDQHNIGRGPFEQRHPLTCGNNSNHAVLEPSRDTQAGIIIMYCPECDYTQPFPEHLAGFIGLGEPEGQTPSTARRLVTAR